MYIPFNIYFIFLNIKFTDWLLNPNPYKQMKRTPSWEADLPTTPQA